MAVMAGCLPEYGPVLRAIADGLLDPKFNLAGVAVTTGGASILTVVSGPIVERLGFHTGANSLGCTARVNATVGRFGNLLRHLFGTIGGQLEEFGTIGHPGRYTFLIAEHPSKRAWGTFHTQFGVASEESAVTLFATEGPNSVNNHYAENAEQLLETIADCVRHYGTTNYYYHDSGYVIVVPPEHRDLLVPAFATRGAFQHALYERAARTTRSLMDIGRIPKPPYNSRAMPVDEAGQRRPVKSEALYYVLESGGSAGKFSAVIPSWVSSNPVCKVVPPAFVTEEATT